MDDHYKEGEPLIVRIDHETEYWFPVPKGTTVLPEALKGYAFTKVRADGSGEGGSRAAISTRWAEINVYGWHTGYITHYCIRHNRHDVLNHPSNPVPEDVPDLGIF